MCGSCVHVCVHIHMWVVCVRVHVRVHVCVFLYRAHLCWGTISQANWFKDQRSYARCRESVPGGLYGHGVSNLLPFLASPRIPLCLCPAGALLYRVASLALAAPGCLALVPSFRLTHNRQQHSSKQVTSFDLSRCDKKERIMPEGHLSVSPAPSPGSKEPSLTPCSSSVALHCHPQEARA